MLDLHAEDEPTVSEIVLAGELLTEREEFWMVSKIS